ncbi:MAG: DUF3857 domain-containing protein [Acidobacteriota bacterium]|nr:DUF3857 domain-containing protein [Acidobacteriota bacterium]
MSSMLSRRKVLTPGWVFALLCLGAVPCNANWFSKGQPVPQWGLDAYKTKTPDYAGDASAVILFDEYIETIDAQGRAVEREREAIRILKPQGRGNSCAVTYTEDQKINYFRVWTIAADEKTYQAQDTDFSEAGDTSVPIMLSTTRVRVAHPPAVDVGATIICESEELMETYSQEKMWEIQNGIPVVFQALELDLPDNRPYSASWHQHSPVPPVEVAPNHWRWEVKNMKPLDLRGIPSHPSWSSLAARMDVQWGSAAVPGNEAQWQQIGDWVTKLEADRPNPSPEITAQTQELIAGAGSFYDKLSRITDYIQKNIRYFIVIRGIGGLRANHAGDIFRNRYGDCKDKTTLLISMLQVAGIHAFYVPVDDRRGIVDPNQPSLYGDHMITAIEIPAGLDDKRLLAITKGKNGTRYLIFDPTDERTPVGNLRSDLQGGYGILAAGPESQLIQIPILPPDANGTNRSGTFTLAADGSLTGSVTAQHFGPEGADLRRLLKSTDQKEQRDYWERTIASDLPGVALKSISVTQPSTLSAPFLLHYQFNASGYSHTAGPLLLVRPRVVGTDSLAFDNKPRTVPIDLDATGQWKDSFDITLPPGYVADDMPDPVKIDFDFASYESSTTAKGNTLHYERVYTVRQVQIPASRAGDFNKLESAILMDERGTAVLKKASEPANQSATHM